MSGKRQRKSNFTIDEVRVIMEEYEANQSILEGKFSPSITNIKKKEVWEEITNKVNALGVAERTITDIQVKWKNMTSNAKLNFNQYKRNFL